MLLAKESYESRTAYFTRGELFETLSPHRCLDLSQAWREGPRAYKYTSVKGAHYEGQWYGGFRDGQGEMRWGDGARYKGTWRLGWAEGKGRMVDKVGNLYEGEFYMSMAHGLGVFTNTIGDVYSGEWRFDKKHGQGVETWVTDSSRYEG